MTSPMQSVSGLASGLDTSTIVSQLMAIERQPLVRLQQAQTVEQARQSALQTVQTKLQALSAAAADLKAASAWGDTQTVGSSDSSVLDVSRVSGATAGATKLWVAQLARADQMTSSSQAAAFTAHAETISIKVGTAAAVPVAIKEGDTLSTIASRINGSSGIGAYATVMTAADGTQQLVLSGKTTGDAATITVGDESGKTLATDLFGPDAGSRTGTGRDSVVSFTDPATPGWTTDANGIRNTSNTVDNVFPGLKLTLKSVGAATVSVGAPGPDTQAVQDKLKAFQSAYNDALAYISGKLNEHRPANPTNDAQRTIGVLSGDPGLSALLSDLRASVSQPLDSAPESMKLLSQAGLSTGATTGSGALDQDAIAGKLSLDADKLSTALDANLEGVKALVAGSGGLADRFKKLLDPWLVGDGKNAALLASRLQSSSSAISENSREQSDMQVRLDAYQQRLQAQFTAMETALSQAQSQGQWLTGQLNALG